MGGGGLEITQMKRPGKKIKNWEKILFQITALHHKEESNPSVGFSVGDSIEA